MFEDAPGLQDATVAALVLVAGACANILVRKSKRNSRSQSTLSRPRKKPKCLCLTSGDFAGDRTGFRVCRTFRNQRVVFKHTRKDMEKLKGNSQPISAALRYFCRA